LVLFEDIYSGPTISGFESTRKMEVVQKPFTKFFKLQRSVLFGVWIT